MTSRTKAEARKAKAIERDKGKDFAKSYKAAVKLIDSLSPEAVERFNKDMAGLGPVEIAKKIARKMLASEVGDKIKADLDDHPIELPAELSGGYNGHTLYGFADSIPENCVVELLEAMVEGDVVIDDGATHQWFRNKLDEYRDACIEMDKNAEETDALATMLNYTQALAEYDIILDTVHGGERGECAFLANEAGRDFVSDLVADDLWTSLPEGIPGSEQWRSAQVVPVDKETFPGRRKLAGLLAEHSSLRVGITGKFGKVEPAMAAEAA